MHPARAKIDEDVARSEETASMLEELATVVDQGPIVVDGKILPSTAIRALRHGAMLARQEKRNLRHVAAIWDDKVQPRVQ